MDNKQPLQPSSNSELSSGFELIAERYQPIELLGKGGSGEVWLCHDLLMDREVALKRLRREKLADDGKLLHPLFYREAKALASLDHPHLVQAYDVGSFADKSPYLVLEYVAGISLEAIWQKQRVIPWSLLGVILDQILSGLAHCHARGVIHSDLKPGNILLHSRDLERVDVRIIDFGTSVFQNEAIGTFRLNDRWTPKLQEKAFLTPHYASPEQLEQPCWFQSPATDLYALGVILFQFCCGKLPFEGEDFETIREHVLYGELPKFVPQNRAPLALEELLAVLLAKKPWQRYAFAAKAREVLRPFLDRGRALEEWEGLLASWGQATSRSKEEGEPWEEHPFETDHLASYEAQNLQRLIHEESEKQESSEASSQNLRLAEQHHTWMLHRSWQEIEPFRETHLRDRMLPGWAVEGENAPNRNDSGSLSSAPSAFETQWIPVHRLKDGGSQSLPPAGLLALQVPALVGREAEQDALWSDVEAVCRNQKRFLLLEGCGGVGKSRLAQWVFEQVHERGVMVGLHASFRRRACAVQGILGAVERHLSLGGLGYERIYESLLMRWGTGEEEVRLAAGLAYLLSPPPTGTSRESIHWAGGAVQLERPEARSQFVLDVLQHIHQEKPLLVWLDDLWHADQESLSFLASLLEQDWPMMIIATWRGNEELDAYVESQVEALVSSPGGKRMELHSLPRKELVLLFDSLLCLDDSVLDTLYRVSVGNPLFALQQMYAWVQGRKVWWDKESRCYQVEAEILQEATSTTHRLWEERLRNLSKPFAKAAIAATTLGSVFERELLESLLERLGVGVEECLLALVQHHILVEEESHFAWTHNLLEEYLVQQFFLLDGGERYAQFAVEVLEEHSLSWTRHFVRLIVQNLLHAERQEEACERLLRHVEVSWKEQRDGHQAVEDLLLVQEHLLPKYEAEWWRWWAEASFLLSRFDEVEHAAKRALSLSEENSNCSGSPDLQRLWGALLNVQGAKEEARVWAQRSLEQAQADDELEPEARAELLLADIAYTCGEFREAEIHFHRALAIAEKCQMKVVRVEAWMGLAFVSHDQGFYRDARPWAERVRSFCDRIGEEFGQGQARFVLGVLDMYRGALEEAERWFQEASTRFQRVQSHWWGLLTRMFQGVLSARQGASSEGMILLRHVYSNLESQAQESQRCAVLLNIAMLLLEEERWSRAASILVRVEHEELKESMLRQQFFLLRAWLAQGRQESEAAKSAFLDAFRIWEEKRMVTPCAVWLLRQLRESYTWEESEEELLRIWSDFLQLEIPPLAPQESGSFETFSSLEL